MPFSWTRKMRTLKPLGHGPKLGSRRGQGMAEYILLLAVVMGVIAVFQVVFLDNFAPRLGARANEMVFYDTKGLDTEKAGPQPVTDRYYTGFGGAHADAKIEVK